MVTASKSKPKLKPKKKSTGPTLSMVMSSMEKLRTNVFMADANLSELAPKK
jgi:hypothetical protein